MGSVAEGAEELSVKGYKYSYADILKFQHFQI